jgi:hypothetical protein
MVLRNAMTIQIPDDLAGGLEGVAAAQRKSVEQVAVESLCALFNRTGFPETTVKGVAKCHSKEARATLAEMLERHEPKVRHLYSTSYP